MVLESKMFILTEDLFANKVWKEVNQINLGSVKEPNNEVNMIKIISL